MFVVLRGKYLAIITVLLLMPALCYAAIQFLDEYESSVPVSAPADWGLSFRQDGEPPIGNVSADSLKQFDAKYIGDTDKKVIYLTFDAGFENGNTPPILEALKKHEVPAAFFLVGNYIKTEPELSKRILDEGHMIVNHTYSHPDMANITEKDMFKEELEALERLHLEITKKEMPRFYRPPQGKYSESNLVLAKELGYKTVFWSLAYVDWYVDKQPSKEEAMNKLTSRIHPGAVVLLHSTSKTNADILDELIIEWKNMGYSFGTLEDLFS